MARSTPVAESETVMSPFHRRGRSGAAATTAARSEPDQPELGDGLRLRPMTGFEEEFLETVIADPNTSRTCNELLARCLVPPGADHRAALDTVRALTPAHRDAALVGLRRRSLGDRVVSQVECPGCSATNEVDFDLSAIDLALDTPPSSVRCRLEDDREAVLRVPTAGDQADLVAVGLTSDAARRTWMLTRTLERLGEASGPFPEDAIRGLPTSIRRGLEEALADASPELDLSMSVQCYSCRLDFTSPFEIRGFFLPSSRAGS